MDKVKLTEDYAELRRMCWDLIAAVKKAIPVVQVEDPIQMRELLEAAMATEKMLVG